MKKVLVVFGGNSPEYEVSCSSAASVIEAIDKDVYEVYRLGITRDNEWYLTVASYDEINDSVGWTKRSDNRSALLSPSKNVNGLIVFDEDKIVEKIDIDVVLPILHGENGEDGTMQGLFELGEYAYVGSDVCASACSMDKVVTRLFADVINMKQPECYYVEPSLVKTDADKYAKEADEYFDGEYPLFVKPSKTGSSVGISKVENIQELKDAMLLASDFDGKVMVEEAIIGKEIKVAVMGKGEDIEVGEVCEIIVKGHIFNDFELKYKGSGTHKEIPAHLAPETTEKIKEAAKEIYRVLGCKGLSRVDFFLKDNDEIYFNEINTIPGISNKSIFSLMFEKKGLSYSDMINRLIAAEVK